MLTSLEILFCSILQLFLFVASSYIHFPLTFKILFEIQKLMPFLQAIPNLKMPPCSLRSIQFIFNIIL